MNAIYSSIVDYLDRINTEQISDFHEHLLQRLHSEQEELMGKIGDGDWSDEIEQQLGDAIAEAIDDFGPDFDEEGNELEEGESDRVKSEEERARGSHVQQNGSGDDSGSDGEEGSGQRAEGSEEEQKEGAAA